MARWLVLSIVFGACGGRAGLEGEPDPSSTATPNELQPPSNIDTAVCKAVALDASGNTKQQACIDCCGSTQFPLSTVYEASCVCGRVLDSSGNRACPGLFLTYDQCSMCCNGKGFGVAIGPSGDVADCFCALKFEQQLCATTVQAPEPNSACQLCCLNHGYLSSAYTSFHRLVCECIDGS